jgi:TonB family protein
MFDYLTSARRAGSLPQGPGALFSVALHAVIVGALVIEQVRSGSDNAEAWEEVIQGLTYIAPPDVNSAASTVQISYEASGGGNGEADPQATIDPRGAMARGAGPGENASASVSGDEADQFASPTDDPYENAFSSVEVETMAARDPASAAPVYPGELMQQGIEGYAAMRFVVDSTGLVDMSTVRILETTHLEFASAVREAMPRMKFTPARLGDQPVRQLAEQMFAFRIERTVTESAKSSSESGPQSRGSPPTVPIRRP